MFPALPAARSLRSQERLPDPAQRTPTSQLSPQQGSSARPHWQRQHGSHDRLCGLRATQNVLMPLMKEELLPTEIEFRELARQIEQWEHDLLDEGSFNTSEAARSDDRGNFGIEVMVSAIQKRNADGHALTLENWRCKAHRDASRGNELGFVLWAKDHWRSICKSGESWEEVDSGGYWVARSKKFQHVDDLYTFLEQQLKDTLNQVFVLCAEVHFKQTPLSKREVTCKTQTTSLVCESKGVVYEPVQTGGVEDTSHEHEPLSESDEKTTSEGDIPSDESWETFLQEDEDREGMPTETGELEADGLVCAESTAENFDILFHPEVQEAEDRKQTQPTQEDEDSVIALDKTIPHDDKKQVKYDSVGENSRVSAGYLDASCEETSLLVPEPSTEQIQQVKACCEAPRTCDEACADSNTSTLSSSLEDVAADDEDECDSEASTADTEGTVRSRSPTDSQATSSQSRSHAAVKQLPEANDAGQSNKAKRFVRAPTHCKGKHAANLSSMHLPKRQRGGNKASSEHVRTLKHSSSKPSEKSEATRSRWLSLPSVGLHICPLRTAFVSFLLYLLVGHETGLHNAVKRCFGNPDVPVKEPARGELKGTRQCTCEDSRTWADEDGDTCWAYNVYIDNGVVTHREACESTISRAHVAQHCRRTCGTCTCGNQKYDGKIEDPDVHKTPTAESLVALWALAGRYPASFAANVRPRLQSQAIAAAREAGLLSYYDKMHDTNS